MAQGCSLTNSDFVHSSCVLYFIHGGAKRSHDLDDLGVPPMTSGNPQMPSKFETGARWPRTRPCPMPTPTKCGQVFLRKLRRWGSWYRFDGEEMAPAATCAMKSGPMGPMFGRSCSCWKASGRTFESSWMHWHDCGRTADLSKFSGKTAVFSTCHGLLNKSPIRRSWTAWMMGPYPCPCLRQWKRWHPGYCWLPRCRRSCGSQIPRSSQVGPCPHRPRLLDGAKSVAPVNLSDSRMLQAASL